MRKILIGILVLLLSILTGCSTSKEVSKLTFYQGDKVKLTKDCFGAISKDSYDKLVSYTSSQNVSAADQMRVAGLLLVLKTGDVAELTEVNTGSIRMKILSGPLNGKEVYTFREMVTKVETKEAENLIAASTKPIIDTTAYSNSGKYNLATVSNNEITDQQRSKYREWDSTFKTKISGYVTLDKKAIQIMEDFKAGKIMKSSKDKVESVWNDMDSVRVSLLNMETPKQFSSAIDDEWWRMLADYRGGVNDRMAGLWQIVMYCDGGLNLEEAKNEVNSCLKTSNDYFSHYTDRQKEFNRIFGE